MTHPLSSSPKRTGPNISFGCSALSGLCLVLGLSLIASFDLHAQVASINPQNLKKLSIEELMEIEVTSVSKGHEKLSEVASAIQVITQEAILRSGATSVPEALRLASNLQVAQINSGSWIISARGFNTVFANKLLVLIDGRTVYTPLFGGVIWDQQSVLLEDVERIEVISGPGGTLWGANAVNGVINIITKKAGDTQGLYYSATVGNFLNHAHTLRYGNKVKDKFFYRIYAQENDRFESAIHSDIKSRDAWRSGQVGFRSEWQPGENDLITLQGDVYLGARETASTPGSFDGQNLIGRWSKQLSEKSDFILQCYYDRYWRADPGVWADELETYDIDFQHRFLLGGNNRILWGVGYRSVQDEVFNRQMSVQILPEKKHLPLYSGFIQDEITIDENLKLTVGTKLLHNVYSGFEIQPSARVAFSLSNQTLWAAVSRAVRAPSRLDVDYHLFVPGLPDPVVAGQPDFESEKLRAFEAGYRSQPGKRSSLSLAVFYNEYRDVYSVEPVAETAYQIQNGSEAETWGAEFSGLYQVSSWWRMRGGFTYFTKDLRASPGREHDPSYLANDAKHHFIVQSMIDLPAKFQFDITARYTDYLPATFATVRVPEYFTFDARISWMTDNLELSVVGQNLYKKEHPEFGVLTIPRGAYARLAIRLSSSASTRK